MDEVLVASRRKGLAAWQEKRLLVVRLAATRKLNAAEIAHASGVCRDSVFDFLRTLFARGVPGLLERGHRGGNRNPKMDAPTQASFAEQVRKGAFRRAKDARQWLLGHGARLALPTCYYWLKKVGASLKVPRKAHLKKDEAKAARFKAELGEKLLELSAGHKGPVRIWVADEHRYGLLPVVRRCWGL